MKTNTKLKKIIILTIVGLVLVLSATFFYINNDLVISKARKVANQAPTEISKNGSVTTGQNSGAGTTDEAGLDTVFGVEEVADNFDDIVM